MKYFLKDTQAKNTHSPNCYYYKGMIGGMIAEITQDKTEAKIFDSEHEAIKEKSTYNLYLKSFEVQTYGN
jgi:hypothetical protein